MLENIWITVLPPQKQLRYQPETDFTYWPLLGPFNNWNVITLSHKSTTSEAFEEINQVLLDGISDNMAPLVQSGISSCLSYLLVWIQITHTSRKYKCKIFSWNRFT